MLSLAGVTMAAKSNDGLRLQKVADQNHAIVGPFGNRTPENLGNNATFGFVVAPGGVVLIDSGGSSQGAAEISELIGDVTDKPVTVAINSGSQDHRWLGNGYFKERGARIVASKAAVEDQRARQRQQLFVIGKLVGQKGMAGTEPVYADETFEESMRFALGGAIFELRMVGPAHTPGDTLIWQPQQRVVFGDDVVYVGRMLGVIPDSNSAHWIEAFEAVASLEPATIVAGPDPPTDPARAGADSLDYLVFRRETVGDFMEGGDDITRSGTLEQSRIAYLADYETLKSRDAQQVFQAMEWE